MEWGKRHEHGVGAQQNMDRAIQFYCDAAKLGEAEARYRLGWIYATGRAGKVDEVLGAAWFKAAASAKYPQAVNQVAKLGADAIELDQAPECILSSEMVARRLPRIGPPASRPQEIARNDSVVVRDVDRNDIKGLVRRLAPDYNLDPNLVLAIIEVESNFNPQARSPKNAHGLMQLIPETAARFGVNNVWDPLDNLRGGMSYLRWLLDHFNGDIELALAGYNAGENAVHKHQGIPPYAETRAYVKRITGMIAAKPRVEASPASASTPTRPIRGDAPTARALADRS